MIECSKCNAIVLAATVQVGLHKCHCPKCGYEFHYQEYMGE